ncbi:hypothetical protein Glove_230g74 [Diversispora epigaea]|uniref:ATP-dependent DNA helicase n=1 Tax=Diversispora epigaea TaxID=1348612 RepID=A0A397IFG6_9GLOM|nr:hypothetical protein Glove_230g74 [Diversispora epigaea]
MGETLIIQLVDIWDKCLIPQYEFFESLRKKVSRLQELERRALIEIRIPYQSRQHPFFFVTGSAGTGKLHIIQLIVEFLKSKNANYLLMAPTGVAAHNIDEETSMVASQMLTFLSILFGRVKKNHLEFGGIPVLFIGDLFQLPPVQGDLIFYSPVWTNFFPLFLTTAYHKQEDESFYQMLEEIRMGNVTENIITKIQQKVCEYNFTVNVLNTTHIVGYRNTASTIGNYLPSVDEHTDL